ncbi:hypothetical protein GOBAR_DD11875 [Gossypium barbadense]|nr:hypothetical protein GOBAR_DD11875 [Gossypium barbadense]
MEKGPANISKIQSSLGCSQSPSHPLSSITTGGVNEEECGSTVRCDNSQHTAPTAPNPNGRGAEGTTNEGRRHNRLGHEKPTRERSNRDLGRAKTEPTNSTYHPPVGRCRKRDLVAGFGGKCSNAGQGLGKPRAPVGWSADLRLHKGTWSWSRWQHFYGHGLGPAGKLVTPGHHRRRPTHPRGNIRLSEMGTLFFSPHIPGTKVPMGARGSRTSKHQVADGV